MKFTIFDKVDTPDGEGRLSAFEDINDVLHGKVYLQGGEPRLYPISNLTLKV